MLWDSVREWMGKMEMKHSGRLGQFRRLNSRCSHYLACTFESPGELYKLRHAQAPPYEIQKELIWGKDRASAV